MLCAVWLLNLLIVGNPTAENRREWNQYLTRVEAGLGIPVSYPALRVSEKRLPMLAGGLLLDCACYQTHHTSE
jgi:hypothetical protein